MIEVHLYGKLRRFAPERAPDAESILRLPPVSGETVRGLAARIGIPMNELGANLFVDGRYADLDTPVADATRVGVFPDDMQLLYKWYFRPQGASEHAD